MSRPPPPDSSRPQVPAGPDSARPDALRPATKAASPDGGIPMLTDVLQLPRYERTELPGTLSEIDWSALELRVQENVMERLVRRSQVLLEEQMRDTLTAVIDRASQSLAIELRDTLSQMLHETVARAVREELTRVHTEIAERGTPAQRPTPGR